MRKDMVAESENLLQKDMPNSKLRARLDLTVEFGLGFISIKTANSALKRIEDEDYQNLGLKKSTIREIVDREEELRIIFQKIVNGEDTSKELAALGDEGRHIFYIYGKQVAGRRIADTQRESRKELRIEDLMEYRVWTERAGRDLSKSLNTAVKMGANQEQLVKDAEKAGFSSSIIEAFRKLSKGGSSKYAKEEARRASIENQEISSLNSSNTDRKISLEEEEEQIEKFAKSIYEKRRKDS